jgi:hypothetical protein
MTLFIGIKNIWRSINELPPVKRALVSVLIIWIGALVWLVTENSLLVWPFLLLGNFLFYKTIYEQIKAAFNKR